jgi:hypothetical protein
MTAPKTWTLLGAFVTCLEAIAVDDGFYTDAGQYVTREPEQIPEEQGALVAVVLENLRPSDAPGLKRKGRLASVVVVGKVSVALDDAQARLHELADDIEKSLDGQQAAFETGLQFPVWQSTDFIPPKDGMRWVGVEIRYTSNAVTRPQP